MDESVNSKETIPKNQTIWVRHIALPQDHGSWVFLLSPLLIGIFAGGRLSSASLFLVIAALSAFLIRQPVTILVKAYSGRRSQRDIPVARFWAMVYSLFGFAALAGLISQGFAFLLILAIPGAPVFAWHLYLVSQRAERRQLGVELVGTGVLALAAPAGFWVGSGSFDPTGWWLFILTWFQSAASIVYAYLRLEQRRLTEKPDLTTRIQMGRRALLYAMFNFTMVFTLSVAGMLPFWLFTPYLLQLWETGLGLVNPAIKVKPTLIGIRQLVVSSIFTILFIIAWKLHA
jgi:YwiC-like protein